MAAHPAHLPRRNPPDQSESRHVVRDHRTGGHKRVFTQYDATYDGRVRADGGTAFYHGVPVLILTFYFAARVDDVGEHHARTAEHVVFEGDVVVYRDVVLNLDVVAYL